MHRVDLRHEITVGKDHHREAPCEITIGKAISSNSRSVSALKLRRANIRDAIASREFGLTGLLPITHEG